MDHKLLGRNIQLCRETLGYTQEDLAERIATSTTHLRGIEEGTRIVDLDMFVRIVNTLGIRADVLLMGLLTVNEEK